MATKLKVKKTADGELGVECPRCDDVVIPGYAQALDYWDCPECGLQFEASSLKAYQRKLQATLRDRDCEEVGDFE